MLSNSEAGEAPPHLSQGWPPPEAGTPEAKATDPPVAAEGGEMPVPATLREATRTVLLPARADAVARGRHLLAADLRERGLGATLADDAELVVSELLANAIRHARPLEGDTVRILWRLLPGGGEDWPGVEIAVVDGGAPWFPRVEEPPTDVDSGRGLGIVRTLTSEWGVEGAGTTHQLVWAVLRDRPRAGAG